MTGQGRQGTFRSPPAAGPGGSALGGQSARPPAGARARAPRTRRSGRAGAALGRAHRLPPGPQPAALSPTAEPRHRLPQTPADHSAHAPGTPPVPNTAGAWRCRSCSWRKLGQGARGRPGPRPLGHSQARRVPTPRRPPPLLARWSAGLAGKESERETALAEAWPVPAPRPPSPCRRERAGSAGPLG